MVIFCGFAVDTLDLLLSIIDCSLHSHQWIDANCNLSLSRHVFCFYFSRLNDIILRIKQDKYRLTFAAVFFYPLKFSLKLKKNIILNCKRINEQLVIYIAYHHFGGSIFFTFNLRTRRCSAVKFNAPVDSWNIPLILLGTTGTSNTNGFRFASVSFFKWIVSFLWCISFEQFCSRFCHSKNCCESWFIFCNVVVWHQIFQFEIIKWKKKKKEMLLLWKRFN